MQQEETNPSCVFREVSNQRKARCFTKTGSGRAQGKVKTRKLRSRFRFFLSPPTVDCAAQRRAEVDTLLPQELERPNPATKQSVFECCFPYVCPEPVLVK
jgi:hypothetical protein